MNKKFIIMAVFAALFFVTLPTVHAATNSLYYTFNQDGTLAESFPMDSSSSKYFWLNSGGKMVIKNGLGGTQQGPLPAADAWRVLYGKNNPLDTGNGYYPQNLFRFVTRSTWNNLSEELPFKITKMNLTDTPNRDGYSGVLLFSRYSGDGQNTYYAGIRQDGTAVIKKKIKIGGASSGTYFTMLQTSQIFPGTYNKTTSPNLIPQDKWMALKLDTINQADGSVKLDLYLDQNYNASTTRTWKLVASATDSNGKYNGTPILGAAYAGIRTDYMDVLFDNYRLTETP
ncbi:MAG: hypothetical protein V4481_02130 [Patescibacteria group bacterium]